MQDIAKKQEGAVGAAGPGQGEPFAIAAATSLQDVRPLVLKQGDGFARVRRQGRRAPGARRRRGRLLPGHPASLPFRARDRAQAAFASQFELAGRQCDADLRSHQPGPVRRRGTSSNWRTTSFISAAPGSFGRRPASNGSRSAISTTGRAASRSPSNSRPTSPTCSRSAASAASVAASFTSPKSRTPRSS